ncbi:hypothetical protein [Ciceribacter sp. RN22]|uniref:hypothetical protein n=1 Tax=Ciceribacter sp. RN22 TaxID=2954932 RepID=UPI002093C0EF|nr:hypothetical protein [Ciceribacter sp. RN22]MCO6177629.1 hypothetical protein [Ciceribacter sp. RN22]
MAAASRAANREAERRNKQMQKAQMFAESASAVESWQNYIDELISVHTTLSDGVDWEKISTKPRPVPPQKASPNEDKEKRTLSEFRPGMLDFLRGGTATLRKKLEDAVALGASRDQREFELQQATFQSALEEWETDAQLASNLLRGDPAAIRQVIQEMQSLSDVHLIGSEIDFSIGKSFIHARPKVHGEEIVPRVRRKQSTGGRLNETPLPLAQFNALYQDYVASVSLKTAGELLRILPLSEVYVTCLAHLLDESTGHKVWSPILSVHFTRCSYENLNLASVDPSEALRNFRHNMRFSKQKGFSPIEPIEVV